MDRSGQGIGQRQEAGISVKGPHVKILPLRNLPAPRRMRRPFGDQIPYGDVSNTHTHTERESEHAARTQSMQSELAGDTTEPQVFIFLDERM